MMNCHIYPKGFSVFGERMSIQRNTTNTQNVQKKNMDNAYCKQIIYNECKKLWHFRNECPNIENDKPKKNAFKGKRKVFMEICNDTNESYDEDKEEDNMAIMSSVHSCDGD